MSEKSFSTYPGKFSCKTCKEEVKSIRFYVDSGKASWICSQKHLSEIQLCQIGYKKKKDYEREKRK